MKSACGGLSPASQGGIRCDYSRISPTLLIRTEILNIFCDQLLGPIRHRLKSAGEEAKRLRLVDEAETAAPVQAKRLYIKLSGDQDPRLRKVELILSMFPGEDPVVLYLEDTKKRLGTQCDIKPALVKELAALLGNENVVVK